MAGRICLGLIAQASLETFSFVRLLAISLPTARISPTLGPTHDVRGHFSSLGDGPLARSCSPEEKKKSNPCGIPGSPHPRHLPEHLPK